MPASPQNVQQVMTALDAAGIINLDKSLKETLSVPGVDDLVAGDIHADWYIAGGSGYGIVVKHDVSSPAGGGATPAGGGATPSA